MSEPCPVCHHPDHRGQRCGAQPDPYVDRSPCRCFADDTDHHDQDDSDLVREVIARALWAGAETSDRFVGYEWNDVADKAMRGAGKLVAALQQHGYVIVPAQQFVDLAAAADGRPLAAAVEARDKDWHDAIAQVRAAMTPSGDIHVNRNPQRFAGAMAGLDEVLRLMEGK